MWKKTIKKTKGACSSPISMTKPIERINPMIILSKLDFYDMIPEACSLYVCALHILDVFGLNASLFLLQKLFCFLQLSFQFTFSPTQSKIL
jgi:hypothetical protein